MRYEKNHFLDLYYEKDKNEMRVLFISEEEIVSIRSRKTQWRLPIRYLEHIEAKESALRFYYRGKDETESIDFSINNRNSIQEYYEKLKQLI